MNAQEVELVKLLQEDLPIDSRPFQKIAQQVGLTETKVLEIVRSWEDVGVMRRIGTILHHRNAGYDANGMSVWVVPVDLINEVARIMISFPEVGHCYQRPPLQGWPYNLFAMIHGKSRQQVREVAARIGRKSGIDKYDILFTVREFKKVSMKYFVDEKPAQ